jgi:N-acetyl-alpha-D-glucosaminyl L-malate synthase BshA
MSQRLRIGISCYPTFGGSGILATELGLELARRGHQVHFVSSQIPFRFDGFVPNAFFHEVEARGYPLFEHDNYALALASKMVEVATFAGLDLFHVHYAIPHATAGYLARQILGAGAFRLVTTLHGTDITVVGADRSYLPVTRFSIEASDLVTVPSRFLREATYENLGVRRDKEIEVISNFVNTSQYAPAAGPATGERLLVHNSNFRPLKRVEDVVRIFAQVRKGRRCELLLIGDGPERSKAERMVRALGLSGSVTFLGKQLNFVEVLQRARVFLLPSASESFGLAALEALSCGVPVVASRVGGLPEVIDHCESGFLEPVGDVPAMATAVARLLDDDALHARMSRRARETAVSRFQMPPLVDRFEAAYRRVLRMPPLPLARSAGEGAS